MEATLRVAAERSGRSNARSARVVNPRRPPSASCSTSFGAGLVRHRRASMANYVITRALLKRIEADSTRAAQPVRSRMPRFIGSMKGLSISRRDVRVRLARADIHLVAGIKKRSC